MRDEFDEAVAERLEDDRVELLVVRPPLAQPDELADLDLLDRRGHGRNERLAQGLHLQVVGHLREARHLLEVAERRLLAVHEIDARHLKLVAVDRKRDRVAVGFVEWSSIVFELPITTTSCTRTSWPSRALSVTPPRLMSPLWYWATCLSKDENAASSRLRFSPGVTNIGGGGEKRGGGVGGRKRRGGSRSGQSASRDGLTSPRHG